MGKDRWQGDGYGRQTNKFYRFSNKLCFPLAGGCQSQHIVESCASMSSFKTDSILKFRINQMNNGIYTDQQPHEMYVGEATITELEIS